MCQSIAVLLPDDELRSFDKDCQTLFDAQKALREKMHDIDGSVDASKLKAGITPALLVALNEVSSPEIKSTIQLMLDNIDLSLTYAVESARRIAEIVDKPAADISGTDMEGHRRKLSGFRGKVIVLDFWYRGCGWCIRSMPQLKQVAEDFKDQPVVLIGMNTDNKEATAKFVIERMKLNYPTLRIGDDVAGKMNVHACPSLLIIDRAGVVRMFHEGYSVNLRDDLDKKIRSLLEEK